MVSFGDEVTLDLPRNGQVTLDTDNSVVIGTSGDRFHKPGVIAFATACKTMFGNTTEVVEVAEAVARGYLPCEKPGCYGL